MCLTEQANVYPSNETAREKYLITSEPIHEDVALTSLIVPDGLSLATLDRRAQVTTIEHSTGVYPDG